MKLSNIFNFSILVFFTLLFVNDFFPETTLAEMLPQKITLIILIALVILKITMVKGSNFKLSKKAYFGLTIYTISLWIVLSLLGGHSQIGLSLDGPLFYIVVLLLGFDLLRVYRQAKQDEDGQQEKAKYYDR